MKKFAIVVIASLVLACAPKKEGTETTDVKKTDSVASTSVTDYYLFKKDTVNRLVRANHQKLVGVSGDLASFKKYISTLENRYLIAVPLALDYVKTCIPANSREADSIFFHFDLLFVFTQDPFSTNLDTNLDRWREQLSHNDFYTPELANLKRNLENCGRGIFMSEGQLYLDMLPDYYYDNFNDRVSEGVREFLRLRRDELRVGFSEDAGMLITFDDLYQRVKIWDLFITKYPSNVFVPAANGLLRTYLETLITGMDNSRIFDFEKNRLKPEIKTLYEKIISENLNLRSTKVISDYYNFLKARDFNGDSTELFLKSKDLSTMLAVQPHTR